MVDGNPDVLPAGYDAYAGYVDDSGIGVTYPQIVAKYPNAIHLSISVHGSPAQCADVESGAMSNWVGYPVGYCSVDRVMELVSLYGRPKRLWTAHYTEVPHICEPSTCAFPGLTISADGTQWHSGTYDESLLNDNFFDFKGASMDAILVGGVPTVYAASPQGHLLEFSKVTSGSSPWSVEDITAAIAAAYPNIPPFLVQP